MGKRKASRGAGRTRGEAGMPTYSSEGASERPEQVRAQGLSVHLGHGRAEGFPQGGRVVVIHREGWAHKHTGRREPGVPRVAGGGLVVRSLTCARPAVRSKDQHHERRPQHCLLHSGERRFRSEPGRLWLCARGRQGLPRRLFGQRDLVCSL